MDDEKWWAAMNNTANEQKKKNRLRSPSISEVTVWAVGRPVGQLPFP